MEVGNLLEVIPARYTPADLDLLQRAYRFAAEAHKDQKRVSGEPYINHCLAVAIILAELHVPAVVVAAGLLHDTVEDTHVSLDDLRREFGSEVAKLVDGVTKLSQLPRVSRMGGAARNGRGRQAPDVDEPDRSRGADLASETLRKTFLAMGEDVRVVLIKLADRLQNMRTLGYLPEDKRKRIARQTLDIFAPLANRLGIWQVKWELEDLAFRHADSDTYKQIAASLANRRSAREKELEDIVAELKDFVAQLGTEAEVTGRPKHIYSIYSKMRRKGVAFDNVMDLRAVRIIVPDIPSCYQVLGMIHTHWRPVPGEFDDYIAAPKDNFYQSLHTAVIYDDGRPLEVQIRTQEMHENAEYGIAAHWRYKEGRPQDADYERRVVWLRQLMDWMHDVDDAGQFVDTMKTDVFSDRVYAFTPRGDIIDLPAGATPIDFAYHVHTDVGHRCRGAKINGKLVGLDYQLKTGDQVEILITKRGGPSRDWLNSNLRLVNTERARTKVRHWFKRQDQDQNVSNGRTHFEREMRRLGVIEPDVERMAKEAGYRHAADLYEALGTGDLSIGRLITKLNLEKDEKSPEITDEALTVPMVGGEAVRVVGLKGLLTQFGKCCKPVPGDDIVGYITRGRGATIHRRDCPNILRSKDRERLVQVSWGEPKTTYPVAVRIFAYDRDGLMRDVSTVIADEHISMSQVKVDVDTKNEATFDMMLNVDNIGQLSRVLTRIESLPNVLEARRVRPG